VTTVALGRLCRECRRLYDGPGVFDGRPACEAFPRGIPTAIVTRTVDHLDPYEGDHGMQFEQMMR